MAKWIVEDRYNSVLDRHRGFTISDALFGPDDAYVASEETLELIGDPVVGLELIHSWHSTESKTAQTAWSPAEQLPAITDKESAVRVIQGAIAEFSKNIEMLEKQIPIIQAATSFKTNYEPGRKPSWFNDADEEEEEEEEEDVLDEDDE